MMDCLSKFCLREIVGQYHFVIYIALVQCYSVLGMFCKYVKIFSSIFFLKTMFFFLVLCLVTAASLINISMNIRHHAISEMKTIVLVCA